MSRRRVGGGAWGGRGWVLPGGVGGYPGPVDAEQVRLIALRLPGVEEYEHGGLPAFRVGGRRFASMLDRDSVNLMPGEEGIRSAVAEWPEWCHEGWFGRRLASVHVEFADMDPEVITELVTEAWAARAPARLVREHRNGQ